MQPSHSHSTAILIDGGFFIKRYYRIYGSHRTPIQVVRDLYAICHRHLHRDEHLYRIFYYDSSPLTKKVHNPISKKSIDFSKSDQCKFRLELFEELKKRRKVALRLGVIRDNNNWVIKPEKTKELLSGQIKRRLYACLTTLLKLKND